MLGYDAGVDMTWRVLGRSTSASGCSCGAQRQERFTPIGMEPVEVTVGGLHAGGGWRILFDSSVRAEPPPPKPPPPKPPPPSTPPRVNSCRMLRFFPRGSFVPKRRHRIDARSALRRDERLHKARRGRARPPQRQRRTDRVRSSGTAVIRPRGSAPPRSPLRSPRPRPSSIRPDEARDAARLAVCAERHPEAELSVSAASRCTRAHRKGRVRRGAWRARRTPPTSW